MAEKTIVTPAEIGEFKSGPSRTATDRKQSAKAIVPTSGEVREVEVYDATPALNRREEIVTGDNADLRFLRFARISVDASTADYEPVSAKLADDEEAIFYVIRGEATLTANGESHALSRGDVLYAGLGATVRVESDAAADIAEYRATECSSTHPVQVVRHKEIERTELAAALGGKRPMTRRTVFKLVDQNVDCCRLLFGDTYMAQPGAVGSYPPHFHGPDGPAGLGADAKEEIYHFRCVSQIEGEPGYVLQNCSRPGEPVNTYVHVFDEQAINVTPSFHDTIAPPAVEFMFTWCLASCTEGRRDWAKVLNRPGYDGERG